MPLLFSINMLINRIVYCNLNRLNYKPGLPTKNRMSAINSLLNMAAFRSRTVDLVACQFESSVVRLEHVRLKLLVVIKFGDANGDVGALAGCVICIVSRWEMLLGGDIDKPPLLSVSTRTYNIYTHFGKKYMLSKKYNCWLLITKILGR